MTRPRGHLFPINGGVQGGGRPLHDLLSAHDKTLVSSVEYIAQAFSGTVQPAW